MTTFDLITLKCPHCGILMSAYELMSYTVHRAETWSDGKTEFGVPEMHLIGICPECSKVFWRDDARIEREEPGQQEEELPSVMDIHDLDWRLDDDRDIKRVAFYQDLLDKGFTDTDEKEFYVRTRIWWSVNDLVRHLATWRSARNLRQLKAIVSHRAKTRKLFARYAEIYRKNLDRLLFIYIKTADVDLLYLANMYREQGNFRKAADILAKVERKGNTWKKVRKKVRRKDRRVFKI